MECIYCKKRVANTVDHVPPQCLFARPLPLDILKIPCCDRCNKNFSKDDEYFRTTLCMRADLAKNPNIIKNIQKVKHSLEREDAKGFAYQILNSITIQEEYKTKGIIQINVPILTVEMNRIYSTIKRIIKALVYKEFADNSIKNVKCIITDQLLYMGDDFIKTIYKTYLPAIRRENIKQIGDGSVFRYSFIVPEDNKRASVWFLQFFEKVTFFCIAV